MYERIFPPVETVLEMEPEELAPFVLRYLSESGQQQLNLHNFTLGGGSDFIAWAGDNLQRRERILQKFAIAWMWLERELFIAPKPGGVTWAFITDRGIKVLESQDFTTYRSEYLLPTDGMDPVLVRKVKPSFIRGDYDTAVFQAFKEVEVRVREKAGLTNSDIGVSLMSMAFNPHNGILVDVDMEESEKKARLALFTGSIGTYKNPSSHRYVELTDPREVADIIRIANQLLRIVDSITT
jgi:uncharacterized protein (TIGR02391 family)